MLTLTPRCRGFFARGGSERSKFFRRGGDALKMSDGVAQTRAFETRGGIPDEFSRTIASEIARSARVAEPAGLWK